MAGLVAATAAGDRTPVYKRLSALVCYAEINIQAEIFHRRTSESGMPTQIMVVDPASCAPAGFLDLPLRTRLESLMTIGPDRMAVAQGTGYCGRTPVRE
jgi:hypothetical protein